MRGLFISLLCLACVRSVAVDGAPSMFDPYYPAEARLCGESDYIEAYSGYPDPARSYVQYCVHRGRILNCGCFDARQQSEVILNITGSVYICACVDIHP